jgi:hypothetical protein
MIFGKLKKWICNFKMKPKQTDLRVIRAREQALEKMKEARSSMSVYLGGF